MDPALEVNIILLVLTYKNEFRSWLYFAVLYMNCYGLVLTVDMTRGPKKAVKLFYVFKKDYGWVIAIWLCTVVSLSLWPCASGDKTVDLRWVLITSNADHTLEDLCQCVVWTCGLSIRMHD